MKRRPPTTNERFGHAVRTVLAAYDLLDFSLAQYAGVSMKTVDAVAAGDDGVTASMQRRIYEALRDVELEQELPAEARESLGVMAEIVATLPPPSVLAAAANQLRHEWRRLRRLTPYTLARRSAVTDALEVAAEAERLVAAAEGSLEWAKAMDLVAKLETAQVVFRRKTLAHLSREDADQFFAALAGLMSHTPDGDTDTVWEDDPWAERLVGKHIWDDIYGYVRDFTAIGAERDQLVSLAEWQEAGARVNSALPGLQVAVERLEHVQDVAGIRKWLQAEEVLVAEERDQLLSGNLLGRAEDVARRRLWLEDLGKQAALRKARCGECDGDLVRHLDELAGKAVDTLELLSRRFFEEPLELLSRRFGEQGAPAAVEIVPPARADASDLIAHLRRIGSPGGYDRAGAENLLGAALFWHEGRDYTVPSWWAIEPTDDVLRHWGIETLEFGWHHSDRVTCIVRWTEGNARFWTVALAPVESARQFEDPTVALFWGYVLAVLHDVTHKRGHLVREAGSGEAPYPSVVVGAEGAEDSRHVVRYRRVGVVLPGGRRHGAIGRPVPAAKRAYGVVGHKMRTHGAASDAMRERALLELGEELPARGVTYCPPHLRGPRGSGDGAAIPDAQHVRLVVAGDAFLTAWRQLFGGA